MKKTFLLILFLGTPLLAQFKFGEAKGLFMSVGVGPRFPIADFADSRNIGSGFDVTISYTDNEFLPVFLYTTVGYQHYPGSLDFYRRTDYSSYPCNMLTISPGVRYYFPALLENIVLLMPIVDVGGHFGYIENLHEFKLGTGKQDYIEDFGKFGFHVGAGFSMFLLDVITYYNYLPSYQYISFDLRVNIPIFVKI
ncbi:MAG: hypothetical protein M1495_08825 [Bacteroidetes bacterium]|nr:hypothetical protein [Bacteroidota bacterium]